MHSFIHSFIHACVHAFMHLCLRSFTQSCHSHNSFIGCPFMCCDFMSCPVIHLFNVIYFIHSFIPFHFNSSQVNSFIHSFPFISIHSIHFTSFNLISFISFHFMWFHFTSYHFISLHVMSFLQCHATPRHASPVQSTPFHDFLSLSLSLSISLSPLLSTSRNYEPVRLLVAAKAPFVLFNFSSAGCSLKQGGRKGSETDQT